MSVVGSGSIDDIVDVPGSQDEGSFDGSRARPSVSKYPFLETSNSIPPLTRRNDRRWQPSQGITFSLERPLVSPAASRLPQGEHRDFSSAASWSSPTKLPSRRTLPSTPVLPPPLEYVPRRNTQKELFESEDEWTSPPHDDVDLGELLEQANASNNKLDESSQTATKRVPSPKASKPQVSRQETQRSNSVAVSGKLLQARESDMASTLDAKSKHDEGRIGSTNAQQSSGMVVPEQDLESPAVGNQYFNGVSRSNAVKLATEVPQSVHQSLGSSHSPGTLNDGFHISNDHLTLREIDRLAQLPRLVTSDAGMFGVGRGKPMKTALAIFYNLDTTISYSYINMGNILGRMSLEIGNAKARSTYIPLFSRQELQEMEDDLLTKRAELRNCAHSLRRVLQLRYVAQGPLNLDPGDPIAQAASTVLVRNFMALEPLDQVVDSQRHVYDAWIALITFYISRHMRGLFASDQGRGKGKKRLRLLRGKERALKRAVRVVLSRFDPIYDYRGFIEDLTPLGPCAVSVKQTNSSLQRLVLMITTSYREQVNLERAAGVGWQKFWIEGDFLRSCRNLSNACWAFTLFEMGRYEYNKKLIAHSPFRSKSRAVSATRRKRVDNRDLERKKISRPELLPFGTAKRTWYDPNRVSLDSAAPPLHNNSQCRSYGAESFQVLSDLSPIYPQSRPFSYAGQMQKRLPAWGEDTNGGTDNNVIPIDALQESESDTKNAEGENPSLPEGSALRDPPLSFGLRGFFMRLDSDASKKQDGSFANPVYWSYALYAGPNDEKVKIHYCKNKADTERIAQLFKGEDVIGFDIEWKANAKFTDGVKKNISLIQIASEERVALFHIARYREDPAVEDLVTPTLKAIMESPDITKVGVAIKGDCTRLRRFMGIKSRGIFELSHLYKLVKYSAGDADCINKRLVSLAAQVEEHLGLPLLKGDERTSDWSLDLDLAQVQYAASDSYAGLQLFYMLEHKRKQLDPVPPRPYHAELNLPIRLTTGESIDTDDEAEDLEEETLQATHAGEPPSIEELTRDFLKIKLACPAIPTPAPSKPKRSAKANAQPYGPEVNMANDWVADWRSKLPQDYKPIAAPASLRAHALWHEQGFTVPEAAALLRDPPLLNTTVATYILDALRAEKLPFDKERLGALILHAPPAMRARHRRFITSAGIEEPND